MRCSPTPGSRTAAVSVAPSRASAAGLMGWRRGARAATSAPTKLMENANAARSFATSWGRPYQSSSQRRPTVRPPTAPPALNKAWTTVGAGQVVAHKPTATQSSPVSYTHLTLPTILRV